MPAAAVPTRAALLPVSIPARFFAAAVIGQIGSWGCLAMAAPNVPGFLGGPGLPLASVHALTLGVLLMVAIGAAFQLLPVATQQPVRHERLMRATSWTFIPGVLVLVIGMAGALVPMMSVGGVLAATGLVLFVIVVADTLRRAKTLAVLAAHGWTALASLGAVVVLGLMLVADFHHGFLPDHARAAAAHFILGGYGFMGVLAIGFSYVLIPMFTLSAAPPPRLGYAALAFAIAALLTALAGTLAHVDPLLAIAGVLGLGASGLYLWAMRLCLKARVRRRLGTAFLLVRAGWALLPAALLLETMVALGVPIPGEHTLFAFLTLFGWLLTFLLGILQKILPFLGAMHATVPGARLVSTAELTTEWPLRVHAACHAVAVVTVALGISFTAPSLVASGAMAGVIGAIAFGWFVLGVWRRIPRLAVPTWQGSR